jgi:hypothetical protein
MQAVGKVVVNLVGFLSNFSLAIPEKIPPPCYD